MRHNGNGLDADQRRRLARIKGYQTRYEIIATRDDRRYLIGYASRQSRRGLLDAMQNRGAMIIDALSVGADDQISFHTKPRVHANLSGWRIGFSGRTQRDSILSGEAPALPESDPDHDRIVDCRAVEPANG